MLSEFIKQKEHTLSTRLQRALNSYLDVFGDVEIEEVDKSNFFKFRDMGEKTWKEFEEAREEWEKMRSNELLGVRKN